uniref:Uncharacterized protein n=1 Tax=Arundo donax TaxID=35708 RepID=A0A0A8Y176_ARUDO
MDHFHRDLSSKVSKLFD